MLDLFQRSKGSQLVPLSFATRFFVPLLTPGFTPKVSGSQEEREEKFGIVEVATDRRRFEKRTRGDSFVRSLFICLAVGDHIARVPKVFRASKLASLVVLVLHYSVYALLTRGHNPFAGCRCE